jgi:glycosyltransferase involved in cell wall biosynthesis
MNNKIARVLISGGRETGGLESFAQALAIGFRELDIDAEVMSPFQLAKSIRLLRDPSILKIFSTTSVFLAPISKNTICVAHGFPRIDGQGKIKFIAILASLFLASKFSKLVSVSNYVAIHLSAIFKIKSQSVIKNPLSKIFFNSHEYISDNKLITYVGRLHSVKNVDKIIDPILDFLGERPNLQFHIVGSGELEGKLREKITRFNDRIVFHGSQDQEFILNILQKTKVFISGCETEALGLCYIEALSQGCNVLMPASGGGLDIDLSLIEKKIFLFELNFSPSFIKRQLDKAISVEYQPWDASPFAPKVIAKAYLEAAMF